MHLFPPFKSNKFEISVGMYLRVISYFCSYGRKLIVWAYAPLFTCHANIVFNIINYYFFDEKMLSMSKKISGLLIICCIWIVVNWFNFWWTTVGVTLNSQFISHNKYVNERYTTRILMYFLIWYNCHQP